VATFKIRDLMVAIRPGLQTPQRPAALDGCCDNASIEQNVVRPLDSFIGTGGCDDDSNLCDNCSLGGTLDCGGCTQCSAKSCLCSCTNGCTATCTVHTCGCTAGCTATGACGCTNHTNCGGSACVRSIHQPLISQMAASDLAKLKSQLQLAMQQVSQRENVLGAAAEAQATVPQTLAQVDALQQKLSEAMDELRARRDWIQKSGAPAPAAPTASEDKK
jgi:hypothetical protein